jgi:hypothetical protein
MTPQNNPTDTWKCPKCGLNNWGLESPCERCGFEVYKERQVNPELLGDPPAATAEAAPTHAYSEVPPDRRPAASPTKMILGLAGALLLIGGVFAPLISVPIAGSVSYVSNGRGDGVIVLILGIVALALVVMRLYKALPVVGALSLLLLGFTYFNFQSRMTELQQNMNTSLAGNPFRGLGEALMSSVQMQWGWGVLIIGALLLILTPLIRE